MRNPNTIADMCETLRPVPHNLFAPSIENSVEDLKRLVYGKMHRLYGDNPRSSSPSGWRRSWETSSAAITM